MNLKFVLSVLEFTHLSIQKNYRTPSPSPEPDVPAAAEQHTWMQESWAADVLMDLNKEAKDMYLDSVCVPQTEKASTNTDPVHEHDVGCLFAEYHEWVHLDSPTTPHSHVLPVEDNTRQ